MLPSFLQTIGTSPFPFLLPLAGSLIGGEETIILITILSVTTHIPPLWTVVLFSFLGTYLKDNCIFLLGSRLINHLEKRKGIQTKMEVIARFLRRVTRDNLFLTLLISKFLYGTRILAILHLSKQRMTQSQFLFYNAAVTGLWIIVVCTLGALAGYGVLDLMGLFGNLSSVVSVLVALALLITLLRLWLSRHFIEEQTP